MDEMFLTQGETFAFAVFLLAGICVGAAYSVCFAVRLMLGGGKISTFVTDAVDAFCDRIRRIRFDSRFGRRAAAVYVRLLCGRCVCLSRHRAKISCKIVRFRVY